jgi:hypothetical protein
MSKNVFGRCPLLAKEGCRFSGGVVGYFAFCISLTTSPSPAVRVLYVICRRAMLGIFSSPLATRESATPFARRRHLPEVKGGDTCRKCPAARSGAAGLCFMGAHKKNVQTLCEILVCTFVNLLNYIDTPPVGRFILLCGRNVI